MLLKVCFALAFLVPLSIPPKLVDTPGQNKAPQDRLRHIIRGIQGKREHIKTRKNNSFVPSSSTIFLLYAISLRLAGNADTVVSAFGTTNRALNADRAAHCRWGAANLGKLRSLLSTTFT